ncbi:MAG: carbohydrate kinase family protein [Chloroflexota bacterium]|nr:carbohydrate kinase family protein [Chloroflexota bacterium]
MSGLGPEVVVVGDALLDVTVRPMAPIRPGADAPAEVIIGCGGQGANLAVRLARQGARVELVCGLGDDPAASLVADALRGEGVAITAVRVEATGGVVILVDAAAERTMLSQRRPFAAAIPAGSVTPNTWAVLSGYLFLEPDVPALADGAARRVVVGCAVPHSAVRGWRQAVAAARPDLLILNREEAKAVGPLENLSGGLVVTAPDEVVASIHAVTARHRLPDGPPPLDTTGAGDAFAAALVTRLRRESWPPSPDVLDPALAGAARLATQVTRVPGAQARVDAESGDAVA